MPDLSTYRRHVRAASLALALIAIGSGSSAGADLKIGGTGAGLAGMDRLAAAFGEHHPEMTIEIVRGLGSSGGIKALLADAIDFSVSSRDLRDEERAAGARSTVYARTPFLLVTHAENPVDNLTLSQLADIFEGKVIRWSDGTPIRLILRPKTDTDTAIIKTMLPSVAASLDAAHRRAGLKIALTDRDAAEYIAELPGSLGMSTAVLVHFDQRHVKPLALDGARPTPEALRDGSYSLAKTLSIVMKEQPNANATAFIDFVWSNEGRSILESTGHLTVDREADR